MVSLIKLRMGIKKVSDIKLGVYSEEYVLEIIYLLEHEGGCISL